MNKEKKEAAEFAVRLLCEAQTTLLHAASHVGMLIQETINHTLRDNPMPIGRLHIDSAIHNANEAARDLDTWNKSVRPGLVTLGEKD